MSPVFAMFTLLVVWAGSLLTTHAVTRPRWGEVIPLVALGIVGTDAHLLRRDPKRAQLVGQPVHRDAVAAAQVGPGRVIEPVELLDEQLGMEAVGTLRPHGMH